MADKLEARLGLKTDEFQKGLTDAKGMFKNFSLDLVSMGAGIAAVTGFLHLMKEAFLETEAGARTLSITTSVLKQAMNDLLNLRGFNLGGLILAGQAGRAADERRIEQRQDLIDQKDIQTLINKALFESYDNTKSRKEQEDAIRKAMDLQLGLATMKAVENNKDLEVVYKRLAANADDTKALDELARLQLEQRDIEQMQFDLRRQKSRLTSMEKQDQEDIAKALREQLQYLESGYKLATLETKNVKFPQMGQGFNVDTSRLASMNISASPAEIEKATGALQTQEETLLKLSRSFAQFFSGVNLGFQGMVDGVITGIKRVVAELIAQAVILAVLTAITGGFGGAGGMNFGGFMQLLGKGMGFGDLGGLFGGGRSRGFAVPTIKQGTGMQNLVFKIDGRDLKTVLKRNP